MTVNTQSIKAIELMIQDAFPQSKVRVVVEESPYIPMTCDLVATVDDYGTRILMALANGYETEAYLARLCIQNIQELIDTKGEES